MYFDWLYLLCLFFYNIYNIYFYDLSRCFSYLIYNCFIYIYIILIIYMHKRYLHDFSISKIYVLFFFCFIFWCIIKLIKLFKFMYTFYIYIHFSELSFINWNGDTKTIISKIIIFFTIIIFQNTFILLLLEKYVIKIYIKSNI